MEGVNAGRETIPFSRFDGKRCAQGLESLRSYRTEWDEKARAFNGNGSGGGTRLVARMFRFSDLVKWWEVFAQRPIVDRTGLSGNFDLVVDYQPEDSTAPDGAALPRVAFREALEKQLGLRLEPAKAKVEVLVIDRFHKVPADN